MKKLFFGFFLLVTKISLCQFTPGNIVVCRVGDGTTALNATSRPVFLDEYTSSGVLVQSLPMPTIASGANMSLTLTGNVSLSGMLTLSADRQFLIIPGYNAVVGVSNPRLTTAIAIPRTIGVVKYDGSINTTTALTDFSSSAEPTSAASTNGIDFWAVTFGGTAPTNGIHYTTLGSSTSVQLNSTAPLTNRGVNVFGGQLYSSAGAPPFNGVSQVGIGTPVTAGQTVIKLSGVTSTIPNQFALLDLDPTVFGSDVLYVADDVVGIQKYSFVGGTWILNGSVGTDSEDYMGLTARISGGFIQIFATRRGGNTGTIRGGEFVLLTDSSGYNGAFTATPVVLAAVSSINTMAFRGVAFAPEAPPPCVTPSIPDISNLNSSSVTLNWNAEATATGGYEYALTTSPIPPGSGTAISDSIYIATGLTTGTQYYFHLRSNCGPFIFSNWVTKAFTPICNVPPSPAITNISSSADIKWGKVNDAVGYEYLISTSNVPLGSGTAITDTFVHVRNLLPISQYYLHIRTNCGAGGFSQWSTTAFTTPCIEPTPIATVNGSEANIKWNKIDNAIGYEYAFTDFRTPPSSGIFVTDTTYTTNLLKEGSSYYFHVRTKCSVNSSFSEWETIDMHTDGLEVYPNPVRNTLTIRLNGSINGNAAVGIMDAMGRMVKKVGMTSNSLTIDVNDLTTGVYLVKYVDGEKKYSVKVVKK